MRLADPREVLDVVEGLREKADTDLQDRDSAIEVMDRFFECLASDQYDMRVQKAYDDGEEVGEWGGVPALGTLAAVTPASIINSIFAYSYPAASLAFTPNGILVVLREPHDPTG